MTLGLRRGPIPRMYGVLTAITSVASHSASRCSGGNSRFWRFQRFPPSFRASASRAAGKKGRLPARAAFGPALFCSRAGLSSDGPRYRTPGKGFVVISGERASSAKHLTSITWPAATTDKAAPHAANTFQTGRRLMRQTVLPTRTSGTSASRSQRSVRWTDRPATGSARCTGMRFGLPLTPESGGPSRQPTAPSALPAPRARRRQEFQNAQQDVDRRHPPGRNPGCRGPRQSRRRV